MPRTIHGLPGIYNQTPLSLGDGDGAALALDAGGRVITAPAPLAATVNSGPSTDAVLTQVTARLVKNAAGNVYSLYATNANAAARFLQLHDKATAPVATDVPRYSFAIPAGTAAAPGVLVLNSDFFTTYGVRFTTGIGYAVSTTFGTFTNAATATEHIVAVHFI